VKTFRGFSDGESFTEIPDAFFADILGNLTDADELKMVLQALWRMAKGEGPIRMVAEAELVESTVGLTPAEIRSGLAKAVDHAILLRAGRGGAVVYFLNSPRGQAAAKAFAEGDLDAALGAASSPLERPNVFTLYEENIGPLTPLIADALKDAETVFSSEWVADAIDLAVKNNKRSWKYCEAILKRWKEEGRAEKQNRRDHQGYSQRDVEEKFRKWVDS
jgi:DNA replication protein